jgi:hypothetical protein
VVVQVVVNVARDGLDVDVLLFVLGAEGADAEIEGVWWACWTGIELRTRE